jgi:diguanylate cyclase (GGDEF)-like protein/PAS domain S-box-containing protein
MQAPRDMPNPSPSAPVDEPRLLMVEDSPLDAELELDALRRHGLSVSALAVVSTEPEYAAQLESFHPDLILADYHVPGLPGERSLDLARARCPQIPFIFVSGVLGEDRAVALLKRGAWDYVLKDRLSRLGPAVTRGLEEARERLRLERERALAMDRLQERTQQMQAIIDTVQDALSFFTAVRDPSGAIVDFRCVYANPVAVSTLRRPFAEVEGSTLLELLPTLRGTEVIGQYIDVVELGQPLAYVLADLEDGNVRGTFEGRAAKLGDGLVVTYRDVTDRHAAERALRESEARYHGLVLSLGEGILLQDEQGTIVECNGAAERILGVPRAELIGRSPSGTGLQPVREDGSAFPWQEHPAMVTARTGRPCRDVVMGISSGNDRRWILSNAEPLIRPGTQRPYAVVNSFADITDLRRAQGGLAASEERFRLAFEESLIGMALVDITAFPGRCLRVNRALSDFLGYPQDQLLSMNLDDLTGDESTPVLSAAVGALVKGDVSHYRAEHDYVHACGRTVSGLLSISLVRDPQGEPLYALISVEDITARKRAEEELAFKALHDNLTGLPNRALLLDHLRTSLARANRIDAVVGVLFIDLDDFKSVNDSFGHVAGDEFLVEVSRRISGSLREADTAARIGGDEFVVVCEDLPDAGIASLVAQRIKASLGADIPIRGQRVGAPASIGIAISTETSTAEELLRDADAAMYLAKRQGGRRWEPADTFVHTPAATMLALEADLREAIRLGQLRIFYQPTFDLQTARMVGVEALLRWEHPERGLLLPQELIRVAERRNLIGPIGIWVLRTACEQAGKWVQRFGDEAPVVSVNISSRQLGGQGLTDQVQQILEQLGLPPRKLCLEITESQFVSVGTAATTDLRTLAAAGIAIAVDDFGTGFAGFDYLRRLPVNTIKIDKSYVDGVGVDPTDSAIVAGVVTLAHSLGLDTVAEGIETDAQRIELRRLGCTTGQGWFWHPALPPEEVDLLIPEPAPTGMVRQLAVRADPAAAADQLP